MDQTEPLRDLDELSHIDAADVRLCARAVLRHPILREGGPKAELLPLIYRHRVELRALYSSYLGYRLDVERRFARLYKASDAAQGRGLAGFSASAYVYLVLTLAALVGVGRQILLSDLVAEVRGAGADAGLRLGESRAELRAFVVALRYLVRVGVLTETEGTVEAAQRDVLHREFAEALITVDLELLDFFIPKLPGDRIDAEGEDAPLPVGVRARRRLVEDPVVLFSDLPPDEEEYLRTHARQEAYRAERYLGLEVEIRAEGMAAVDPDGLLTDLQFPGTSTVARIGLAALPTLLGDAEPDERGMLPVTEDALSAVCADLVERYPDTWAKSDTANMDTLATRVADHLLAAGVARRSEFGSLLIVPAAFRWDPVLEDHDPPDPEIPEQQVAADSDAFSEEPLF